MVAVAEWEGSGRIGLEWYYTGEQRLETDPTRTTSEPYVIVGLLAERRLGRFRLFINGENLGDTRQTKWAPILLPGPRAGWSNRDRRLGAARGPHDQRRTSRDMVTN